MERRTRRGRVFYGCKNYPECDFVTWDAPHTEPCKVCGGLVLKHRFKNGRALNYCYDDKCASRVDHPINKELERLREKAEKAASGVKTEKKTAVKATVKKTAAKKTTAGKTTAKKTAAKKAAAKKTAVKKTAAKKDSKK